MLQVIPTLFLLFMQGALGTDSMPGRWDVALLRMAASHGAPRLVHEVAPEPQDSEEANSLARLQLLTWLVALDSSSESGGVLPVLAPRCQQEFSRDDASLPARPDHGFGGLTRDGPWA